MVKIGGYMVGVIGYLIHYGHDLHAYHNAAHYRKHKKDGGKPHEFSLWTQCGIVGMTMIWEQYLE